MRTPDDTAVWQHGHWCLFQAANGKFVVQKDLHCRPTDLRKPRLETINKYGEQELQATKVPEAAHFPVTPFSRVKARA